jgi:hypothetical protein
MFSNHANLRPRDHYEKAGNFGLKLARLALLELTWDRDQTT